MENLALRLREGIRRLGLRRFVLEVWMIIEEKSSAPVPFAKGAEALLFIPRRSAEPGAVAVRFKGEGFPFYAAKCPSAASTISKIWASSPVAASMYTRYSRSSYRPGIS